jgi:peptide/nickel transport system ATP-binding protein
MNTRLSTIEGAAPSLADRPSACVFAPRCPVAIAKCHVEKPQLENVGNGRFVRCWRWEEIVSDEVVLMNKPRGKIATLTPSREYVLEAKNIYKQFGERSLLDRLTGREAEYVRAVDGVSLKIRSGTTLGLVGESGSGKTTLARCIVALEEATSGEMELCEIPISNKLWERPMEALRNLQMVFQNPHDTLNPYQTVGQAIGRMLRRLSRESLSPKEQRHHVIQLLESVGLTADYVDRYPNQLSGGEKQRVAIARAFAASPALIVADEPTSSLDVSVQATILNLLKDLRAQEGASYLFISHDLEVIRYLADWIVVMYLGEVMEVGPNGPVTNPPFHPYTEALLSAVPVPDPAVKNKHIRLEGDVPSPRNKHSGCPFHTRCPRKIGAICEDEAPPFRDAGAGHFIRCHIPVDDLIAMQEDR